MESRGHEVGDDRGGEGDEDGVVGLGVLILPSVLMRGRRGECSVGYPGMG